MNDKPINAPVYPPSAASVFATAARESTIIAYCETCKVRRRMDYLRDEREYEVYRCPVCGRLRLFAVR